MHILVNDKIRSKRSEQVCDSVDNFGGIDEIR